MKKGLSICIVVVFLLFVDAMGGYTQGFVDLDNLQLLAGDWLQVDGSDMDDFAILAQYWYTDQTPPTPDHHWPFEDVSGTEVNDIIGHEKLVETAGFTIADANIFGRAGYGIRFEGGNDERISHPTLLDDLDTTDSITIMMWVRPMSDNLSTGGGLFQKQNNSTADQLQFYAPKDGSYRVQLRNNGNDGGGSDMSTLTGVAVEVDVWRHVAFVWTPTDAYLYIDGQLEDTEAEGTMGAGTYVDMTLGTGNIFLNPFGGTIDDVRIYYSALSAAQIANVYDSYPPVTYYTLAVTDGPYGSGATGSGDYLNAQVVPIAAGTPMPGFIFMEWAGDTQYVDNVNAASTFVTMPAADITLMAVYCIGGGTYLTVNNGTGDGLYLEGATVPIEADEPTDPNDIFSGWTGDIQYLDDPTAASTTVTMPAIEIAVTATYTNRLNLLDLHLELEETSGTDFADSSGNGNDFFLYIHSSDPNIDDIADITTTDAVLGNAIALGSGGACPSHASFLDTVPVDGFTISGWLKPDITGMTADMFWACKRNDNLNDAFALFFDQNSGVPGDFRALARSGASGTYGFYSGLGPWVDDTWYHYVFTWSTTQATIWIDGVEGNSYNVSVMGDGTSLNFMLGNGGLGHVNPYQGGMDDIRVYRTILTAVQIKELYEEAPAM